MMAAPPPARILLVDDEPDILASMSELLQVARGDVEIKTARSGKDALDLLRTNDVDLIVTDFRMPGMNGVEMLQAAQAIAPDTPNILVTAYDVSRVESASLPQRVITKPFDINEFLGAVEDALVGAD